ncbi:MAG: hypothetical protein A3J79_14130 [Elusimicrobia bacterium RIFOXYB2_FULL_62_6]|nr:MAG: hypothetical protein A3J79_14130 [Elusimicrobia bacterium RIFOXYB2_FULL_62_6]
MIKRADKPVRARPLRDISQKRRYVYGRYNPDRLYACGPRDVKNVLVIDAASRSGSSFLHSLLARHPDVISLNGEDIVFQKLHGLCAVASAKDSDLLPRDFRPGKDLAAAVAADILKDAGCLYTGRGRFPKENFLADCVQRFLLQWPLAGADPDLLHRRAAEALERAPRPGPGFDTARLWNSFLAAVAGDGVRVDASYYDMPHRSAKRPESPPAGDCLEEPPFVIPGPRSFPDDGIRGKTLLLKSSSDCYRAGFVKSLFPAARCRFLLLARNPLASISGLMDGWNSGGFFSRDVGRVAKLSIKGYTAPDKPWSSSWWKFDLPPGWAGFAGKPLEEVCAFQWLSANEQILRDADSGLLGEKLRVRYEDLLAPASLARELGKILDFAGLAARDLAAGAARPVMSVTAPKPGKWLRRKSLLLPLCSGKIRAAAERLGYDPGEAEKWQ